MNIKEAHEQHLDVFFHATEGSRTAHSAAMHANNRVVVPFEELMGEFNMLCTAVGPRLKQGETANAVRSLRQ